jgi:inosose dehydratase
MDRRQFILGAAAAAAWGADLGIADEKKEKEAPAPKPPAVGSQLYGWGQYYAREGKDLGKHLDDVLGAIRDAGYEYAEGSLDVASPDNNAKFGDRLRKKGLRPVSLYTGGATHVLGQATQTCERIAKAAKDAAKAGFRIINFNPDPIGRPKTDRELEIQGEALAELGEELSRMGVRLGIHHHTPELANGGLEFHSNFRHGRPDHVGFCYDVHWVYRGGIAPADALARYGDRIVSWHLRQSRGQTWWEDLDSGDIDFAAIAQEVRVRRLPQFFTVELAIEAGTAITRGVVENHARSRKFVRSVLGV